MKNKNKKINHENTKAEDKIINFIKKHEENSSSRCFIGIIRYDSVYQKK